MYILVDIGGTKIRMAGSTGSESFTEPMIFDTPQNYAEGIAAIHAHARGIAGKTSIDRMAVGVPSMLSRDKRTLIGVATNILEWSGKSLADDLEKTISTHVLLENDTALVGLGEARFGAGKDAEIVVYITVSTGVNGVRVVNGMIDPSAFGFAIGHQYITMDQHPQLWERMISGRAIFERFGVPPRDLGKDHEVWEELARVTAFGVHNAIVHWSPDRVVLGGSMFNDIGISVERIKVHLKEITQAMPEMTSVTHGLLGDVGGLWGGLALLK